MHLSCDNRLNFSQVCEVRKNNTNNASEMKNDDLRLIMPQECAQIFLSQEVPKVTVKRIQICSVQFSCSVMSDSLWPHGLQHTRLPYHQLPELVQTYVHQGGDAIQPSHPLSSPSPPAFNLSKHQGLFQWVISSHQVAKVLELQHQSFQ